MKKLTAVLLSATLIISSFGFVQTSYGVEDTKGPEVDLNSLQLSTQTITDPYESPLIQVKITDESEIVSVSFAYRVDGEDHASASADLTYNNESGYFEGTVNYGLVDWSIDGGKPVACYGTYELWHISTSDAYGNFSYVESFPNTNGNFTVVGGNPDDQTAPMIDFENIRITQPTENGQPVVVTISIADDSVVYDGWISYRNKNIPEDYVSGYMVRKGNGIYQAKLHLESAGEYHLESISVADANNNLTYIKNTDSFAYTEGWYENAESKALGFLNIQYGHHVEGSVSVSIQSMDLSDAIINRDGKGTLTVVYQSSAPLKSVETYYEFIRGTTQCMYAAETTKIDDSTFVFTLPSVYYGPWTLIHMYITDVNGKHITLYNPDARESLDGVPVDLSSGNFYVGIIDSETGLGISDTEFDKTTKLNVEEDSVNSALGQDMVEDDAIGIGMYDVDVTGKRNDKTAVSFVAPEGLMDGDKVEIVHKRHDGSNEIFDAEVKHGRITIETDEFSPFVIQVAKDHEHRYTSKNIIKKATTKQNGKYQEKCYACDAVGKTKTLKPAKVSLSKDGFTYTGKNISGKNLPNVIVKDADGKIISAKEYTVKKPSNVKKMKNVGRYPYKVTFKNSCQAYKGTKTVYLTVKPKATSVSTVKAAKKAITVRWRKGTKEQITGYEILLATNNNFTKGKKTVTVKGYKATSKEVTKLKAKKKYYVKVRTYKTVNGKKIYSDWSKAKTCKTK